MKFHVLKGNLIGTSWPTTMKSRKQK